MDFTTRRIVKVALIIIVALVFVIIESVRLYKRRRERNNASALGAEEYLRYLKTEYRELKFKYKTAGSDKEREKWMREMQDIERRIILTERDMEDNS